MLATQTDSVKKASAEVSSPTKETPRRSLSDLVALICRDAKEDSISYLLRSNTSHDGE